MTKQSWVCADQHFGHTNICKFTNDDGSPLRPWDDVAEMDEALVKNWNDRVGEFDRVYLLGDVVINRRHMHTLSRLKGKKVLVKGNHDIFALSDYLPHFEDIRAYAVKNRLKLFDGRMANVIMTHIPIHTESLARWDMNIHGHLHSGHVKDKHGKPDKRYVCVSVEHTNYAPITLDEAVLRGF